MIDSQEFIIKGMQRDLSVSKFNPEFAFENMNIRITARENNTLLSITNEKGNKLCNTSYKNNKITRSAAVLSGSGEDQKYGIRFYSEYPLDGPITLMSFPSPGYENLGSTVPDTEIILTNDTINNDKVFWVSSFIYAMYKSFNVVKQNPVDSICYYSNKNYVQPIPEITSPLLVKGECIGKEVINDYLILFTVSEDDPNGNNSRIYRLDYDSSKFKVNLLYHGNLGFNKSCPIESIGVFENENLQKVYWTDGLNQPRFINIVASEDKWSSSRKENKWNDMSFNFVSTLKLNESITITKEISSGGMFPSGVVQYAFTYYNRYGQQSNVFYVSPFYYNTFSARGASPEEKLGIGYKITVTGLDSNFDYLRIYSIVRTSTDATPTVKRVADLQVSGNSTSFIDSNITGDIIDPTELLYMGGEEAVFGCMCQKDNTLFLGDIRLKRSLIPKSIKDSFKIRAFTATKVIQNVKSVQGSYYAYDNQLGKNSYEVTTFKRRETYRTGIQFQHTSGKWSEVLYIEDLTIYSMPSISSISINGVAPQYTYSASSMQSTIRTLIDMGYVRARAVVVYPSLSERSIICQGFVCPTVYNVGDRANNGPFVQSSWFLRPDLNIQNYTLSTEHNQPLYKSNIWGAEIQSMSVGVSGNNLPGPFIDNTDEARNTFVANYSDFYYVDRSICTLHSPDIEFDEALRSVNFSQLSFRIVGKAGVIALNWDADITLETPPNNSEVGGITKIKSVGLNAGGKNTFRPIASYVLYFDSHDRNDAKAVDQFDGGSAAYPVYVWNRDGSLANAKFNRYGKLGKKKFSQLVYCNIPKYYEDEIVWSPKNGISDAQVFDSSEVIPLMLKGPGSFGQDNLFYYGNIDKLLTAPRIGNRKEGYPIAVAGWTDRTESGSGLTGYVDQVKASTSNTWVYIADLKDNNNPWGDGKIPTADEAVTMATDPIRIKYKSSPHIAFVLNEYDSTHQQTIPRNSSTEYQFAGNNTRSFWNSKIQGYNVPKSPDGYSTQPVVWIGEFYNSSLDPDNLFGGKTEDALASNRWVPAGPSVPIAGQNGEPINFTIKLLQGDTYIQRYDHLKTYPFTLEDQNSLVEIVSIPLETRINIDGRYDKNRGYPGFTLTPVNFNLMNDVYSQQDNFFIQQYVNRDRAEEDNFVNSITWTKTKSLSEDIDTWTNITLASTLDLDGDMGRLRAMKLFNNEIIAFQDNAISNILFNSRVQMNASDGIPIEIANSGKVDGKRYISNHIGTVNKFSIIETPAGLYFMDNNSTSIYQYNGQLNDISDGLGFRAWCSDHIKSDEFNKSLDQIFTGHYDRSNSDLYFNNPDFSLGFSSLLNQFTSFYSYENIPFMFNIRDKFFSLKFQMGNTEVWEQNAGDYNYYYGEFKPFYTHIIANKDMTKDKIFNTLEFRADSYEGESILTYNTFDRLDAWNEYQTGSIVLNDKINHPSSLKKKFRVWKANFPREEGKPLNRIRNTWVNVKLGKYTPNKLRTVLHDMKVYYTI